MKIPNSQLLVLSEVAVEAAKEAGDYIQSRFDQSYVTQSKIGGDSLASQVVTEVDLRAQEIILDHLSPTIKSHDLGLLAEETSDDASRFTKDYFWCIDPMDGTLPFTEHRTGYAVSIALVSQAGDPIVGVVYVPDKGWCYAAIKGKGVQLNGKPFKKEEKSDVLHFYMDRSFLSEPGFDTIKSKMRSFASPGLVQYHSDYGGVRNALGVMSAGWGCYFKFPKPRNGCGSIWDYAATRLFFEELGLPISNFSGDKLHLNNPETTFMNDQGILYSTDEKLAQFIKGL